MKNYYIHNGTEQQGPFNIDELKSKNITPETMVWYEGLENWQQANVIVELKDLFKSIPPPIQTAKPITPPPLPSNSEEEEKPNNRTRKYLLSSLTIILVIVTIGIVLNNTKESAKREAVNEIREDEQAKENQKEREKQEQQVKNEKELAQRVLYIRNHCKDYIYSEGSSYNYSILGGISNFFVTVRNNTAQKVDKVYVRVTYIKSNGDIWDTKTLVFYDVPAKGVLQQKAPDTGRGTSVEQKTIAIVCSGLNLCYSEDIKVVPDDTDPYRCR